MSSESSPQEEIGPLEVVDPETRELLGLFDVPAFARRGTEIEHLRRSLRARLERERSAMLDMARLRLKEWSRVADLPNAPPFDDRPRTREAIESAFAAVGLPSPAWAERPASPRVRRRVAKDLIAAFERFNRRWTAFVRALDTSGVNRSIDQYNQNYVFEKECVLGSARLAARHFVPLPLVSAESILEEFPLLPTLDANG